ncbi:MAG: diguanylate cyclase [Gammaproteobacteria bacterium]
MLRYILSATGPWRWLALLAVLSCQAVAAPRAAPPLAWPPAEGDLAPLSGQFSVLLDAANALPPADVVAGRHDAEFLPAVPANTNLGFTSASVWTRFALRYADEPGPAPVLVLPRPLIDDVQLFSVTADGRVTRVVTGDAHPFASRPIAYRAFAFPLTPRAGETVTYYLRARSATGALAVPLELYSAPDFAARSAAENFLRGGFIGLLVGLALCALALYTLVRNTAYAYYCQYLVAFGLLMAAIDGYAMQFLWPHAPLAQAVLPAALLALTNVTGTLFVRSFLGLPRLLPRSEAPFALLCVLSAFGVALHLFHGDGLGAEVVMLAAAGLDLLAIYGTFAAWRAGDRVAGYLLAGWAAFALGMFVTVLELLGALPASRSAASAIHFGALGYMVALATGLCDRLWRVQRVRASQIAAANADLARLNASLEQRVLARTRELEVRNRELSELAVRDGLTGLYNHSATIELLEQLMQQSGRYEFPVAVMMLDLDNFKQLNDGHGHQVGDLVLEEVSRTLLESVRGSDLVGRYGGEEFLVALSHADVLAAREYGERLLGRIRELKVGDTAISASLGVSVFHPRGHRVSARDVIRRADEALYRSKREGRDRLTVDSLSLVVAKEVERRAEIPPQRP